MLISRKDFEAWVELLGAEIVVSPDYRSSQIMVEGKHKNEVKFRFTVSGMDARCGAVFYARGEGWNSINIDKSACYLFNHYGKGARSQETWKLADEALKLLLPADVCYTPDGTPTYPALDLSAVKAPVTMIFA
jgi:hypothetical protein